MENAFALFDTDGDGQISFEDLKAVATELGEDMTDEELKEMIAGGNKGVADGSVSQSGFFNILNKSNS